MKYYFVGHTSKFKKYLGLYTVIIDTLLGYGWELTDNWVKRETEIQLSKLKKEKKIQKYYKNLFATTTSKIKQSDLVVAEVSEKSTTASQQIIYALDRNIPVWCLCLKEKEENIPTFLKTCDTNKLMISLYKKDNLPQLLKDQAKKFFRREFKFNFYINQEMKDFLEKKAIEQKSTMSKILREIISREMDKETFSS